MYYNENNVAGAGGRKVNYADGTVAGDFFRRGCGNEVGGTGRVRCDCECVYGCLLELIEDAFEENNNNHHHVCCGNWVNPVSPGGGSRRRCDCVYECLYELLEDALEEDNNNNHHCCRCCRR